MAVHVELLTPSRSAKRRLRGVQCKAEPLPWQSLSSSPTARLCTGSDECFGWRLVAVGGGWCLAIEGWWGLVVGGRRGWWRLAVGGWRLAVGGWRLAVGGP